MRTPISSPRASRGIGQSFVVRSIRPGQYTQPFIVKSGARLSLWHTLVLQLDIEVHPIGSTTVRGMGRAAIESRSISRPQEWLKELFAHLRVCLEGYKTLRYYLMKVIIICWDVKQARKRAIRQDDREYPIGIDLDPSSNLLLEGFTYVNYRVGCPPLQVLPLKCHSVPGSKGQAQSGIHRLHDQIEEIIQRHGLILAGPHEDPAWCSEPEVELMYRSLPNQEPTQEDMTLLVPAY